MDEILTYFGLSLLNFKIFIRLPFLNTLNEMMKRI